MVDTISLNRHLNDYTKLEQQFIFKIYYSNYVGNLWKYLSKYDSILDGFISIENVPKILSQINVEFNNKDEIFKNKNKVLIDDFLLYIEENSKNDKDKTGIFFLDNKSTEDYLIEKNNITNFREDINRLKKKITVTLNIPNNIIELKKLIKKNTPEDTNLNFVYSNIKLKQALDTDDKNKIIQEYLKVNLFILFFNKISVKTDEFIKSCESLIYDLEDNIEDLVILVEETEKKIYSSSIILYRNLRELFSDIIKNKIEMYLKKLTASSSPDEIIQYYPNFYNQNFNEIIYNKNEFNKYKTQLGELQNLVVTESFKKTNTQKFIQKFLNPNTPYNGIFLWHGVGSGKTCTGITIAENFRNISVNMKQKILILLPSGIFEDNWYNEIFNIDKEFNKENSRINVQCTGNIYSKYFDSINKFPAELINLKTANLQTLIVQLNKLSIKFPNEKKKNDVILLQVSENKKGIKEIILKQIELLLKTDIKIKLKKKIKKYINNYYDISTYGKLSNKI